MTTSTAPMPAATRTTLEEHLLTASLLVAPVAYLATDTLFAARGWEDATGGVLQVLASVAYGFVFLRVAAWLSPAARLRAALVVVGTIGMAGAVAYGFDTIHLSLGDTELVDRSGAANLIKPLGLFFPLALALVAAGLVRLGARWQGGLVLVAALAWPVGHIGNVAPLCVAVNVLLLLGLGSLLWQPPTAQRP
jgi:hypothetical protein